jgi:hypothetical protein
MELEGLDIPEGRDGDAKKAWFLRGFVPDSVFFGIFVVENGGGLGRIGRSEIKRDISRRK